MDCSNWHDNPFMWHPMPLTLVKPLWTCLCTTRWKYQLAGECIGYYRKWINQSFPLAANTDLVRLLQHRTNFIKRLEPHCETADIADGNITSEKLSSTLLEYLKPKVISSPNLSTHSGDVVYAGQTLNLMVEADGRNLSYQWQRNGDEIQGETNATLIISDVIPVSTTVSIQ